jgi:hypothetical protein
VVHTPRYRLQYDKRRFSSSIAVALDMKKFEVTLSPSEAEALVIPILLDGNADTLLPGLRGS